MKEILPLILELYDSMKNFHCDYVTFDGQGNLIRISMEDGDLLIRIHTKETEELCSASNE